MNGGEREKRFRNKTKGIRKSSIKAGIDFIYRQIEKVNLDATWARLRRSSVYDDKNDDVFANRSHTNVTKEESSSSKLQSVLLNLFGKVLWAYFLLFSLFNPGSPLVRIL